ncbi:MAG: GntR family transcriptional regulator [Cryobacterium sp.]|nr:GntR family transcriptional regulator [Cryobacterium sp.]
MAKYVDANGLVYKSLVERISDGSLAPGAKLREGAIAEELGTSRTPVREALRTLAAEGLVEIEQNRGATVRAWTHEQILETYGMRAVLQGYAARLASRSTDAARLERLDELQDQMERVIFDREPGYLDDLAELNDDFHHVIVQMANSAILENIINTLTSVAMVGRTFRGFENEDLQRSMMHHRDIIRGIRAHDAEFTEAVMTSHILAARPAALAMLRRVDTVDSAD